MASGLAIEHFAASGGEKAWGLHCMHLIILVGTMTGTAKLVAEEIQLTFEDDSTSVEVKLMDDLAD